MTEPRPPEFWRAVARQSPDPLVVVDRNGSIFFASDGIMPLLGWEPGELVGRPVEILVPESLRGEHVRHHRALGEALPSRLMGGGRKLSAQAKDGRVIEVEIGLSSLKWPGGSGFMATLRPVSRQRRLEAACHSVFRETALVAGKNFFEALVRSLALSAGIDCALVSIFSSGSRDKLRTLAFWRDGCLAPSMEYPIPGTPCAGVVAGAEGVYPEGVRKSFPDDRDLAELGAEAYLGVPLFGSSGEVLGNIVLLHGRPLEQPADYLVILRMFAMRAAAELERSASEENLEAEMEARKSVELCQQALVEVAFILSSTLDQKAMLQQVMATICNVLGWVEGAIWEVDEPAGLLRCRQFYGGKLGAEGREFEAATRTMTFAPGIGLPGRVWASAQSEWISDVQTDPNFPRAPMAKAAGLRAAFASPIAFGGRIRGVLEFFRHAGGGPSPGLMESMRVLGIHLGNCWEREQTQALREKAQADLLQAQKMDAVGRLAGGIAHDFNNILTAVLGYCDLLAPEFPPGDPRGADIREIKDASQRAVRLTSQLLAFSRRQVIKAVVLDVGEIIGTMGSMLRRLVREDIKLHFEPGSVPIRVLMDRGQLEQVLVNLVVNAADAVIGAGEIAVKIGQVMVGEEQSDELAGLRLGPHALISVRDTGKGMDPEVMEKIFEPFFTTKSPGKGTGLGLATVYGIVKQAGGAIEVESSPGKGSEFGIYLPLAKGDAPVAQESREDLRGGDENILVVEDEEMVRKVLCRELAALGYKVFSFGRGVDALEMMKKSSVKADLLLTDVVMPEMNGLELSREAERVSPEIKILLMSGYAEPLLSGDDARADHYPLLEKPFSSDSLAAAVRRALNRP